MVVTSNGNAPSLSRYITPNSTSTAQHTEHIVHVTCGIDSYHALSCIACRPLSFLRVPDLDLLPPCTSISHLLSPPTLPSLLLSLDPTPLLLTPHHVPYHSTFTALSQGLGAYSTQLQKMQREDVAYAPRKQEGEQDFARCTATSFKI
jgi:hypothetical protein